MRILFLGYVVSKAEANVLSGASTAGNNFQLGIIESLTGSSGNVRVDALALYPIAPFPRDPTICLRHSTATISSTASVRRVGFVNLPILKQLTQTLSLISEGTRLTWRRKYDCVLAYNMYPQVGISARWIGRLFKIPVVAILADLPIDPSPNRAWFSRIPVVVFNWITERLIRRCKSVIVLNRRAADKYAPQARYMVLDGAVTVDKALPLPSPSNSGGTFPRRVVFTGALVDYNGIVELIAAMRSVRTKDVVLDIYGNGPLKTLAQSASDTMPNVRYHGRLGSDAIAEVQRNAFLLVNPRPVNDPISEVTFPSKLLEYMLSGTPVLTTRLNSLTDEYDGKLYLLDDGSASSIARAIDDLAAKPPEELRRTASKARSFILDERTWMSRGPELVRFLEGISR